MVKFSIVVPIYNVEQYLKQAIDSLLAQEGDDFEIICVNDGSKDKSEKILDSYKDNKKIIVINKENGGLISARTAGILKAEGEYVISLDGDDYFRDDFLSGLRDLLKEDDYDIVIWQGQTFNEKTILGEMNNNYEKEILIKEDYERYLYPIMVGGLKNRKTILNSIVCKAVKKDIMLNALKFYNPKVSMGEDLLISTACLLNSKKIRFTKERYYYYRQTDTQMTHGYKRNLIENEDILIQELNKIIEDSGSLDNKKYICLHALNMAKSTIFNEIKYKKSNKEVFSMIKKVIDSFSVQYIRENADVAILNKLEKMIYSLLKNKAKLSLYVLGKLYYYIKH